MEIITSYFEIKHIGLAISGPYPSDKLNGKSGVTQLVTPLSCIQRHVETWFHVLVMIAHLLHVTLEFIEYSGTA